MVIDLGYEREAPATRLRDWWRPSRVLRPLTYAVCAGLLLAVAASAPAPGPVLVPTASYALEPRTDFVVLGDRLYVSAATTESTGQPAEHRWLLSAYELPSGRPLWTAPYESSVEQVVDLQAADGLVLITGLVAGEGISTPTTAMDAETGRVLWSLPVRVVVADGRTGLVGGWSPRLPAPAGSTVRAVDLRTGQELWEAAYPVSATIRPVGDGRAMVLTGDGRVELRDAHSGALRASRVVPPPGAGPSFAVTAGDTVVLGYQDTSGSVGIAAYDRNTLEPRWTRAVAEEEGRRISACGRWICTGTSGGIEAIDPATGALGWAVAGADAVFEAGGVLVASAPGAGLAAVEPDSGRTLFDLAGWETSVAVSEGTGLVAVARGRGEQTWLSIAAPHTEAPRMLGVLPYRVWDCVPGTESVVCRAPTDQLRIWTYH
ncbi:PQQ-binding-like beta-propeller repeat protein [Phytohabitans rumicis]|uniref:outer membrane protein assembly factor BamB family protein n=1 Tax=Phytohabitans rumicis TaxID=1076125 RepID=UPI0031E58156